MKKLPSVRMFVAYYLLVLMMIIAPFASAVIIGSLPYTLTNGTTADATHVMANYQKILDDVNANAAANGANSDITAILGLTTPLGATSGGTNHFPGATTAGSANAQTLATTSPDTFTLTAGYSVSFTAGFTNTAATTLTINGTTATNLFKRTPAGAIALTGGELVSGSKYTVSYDGTQFQLTTPSDMAFGALTNLASGGTTDLGSIGSHNVNVTGTTTITALGSSANTTYPLYRLTFAGALTLTYNASSLIVPGNVSILTAANDHAWAHYLGSGNWQILEYTRNVVAPQAGQLQGIQYFVANGTWTRPTGVRSAQFICGGGGGAGGGSANTGAGAGSAGAGGGAGGYAELYVAAAASSYTITIPAAATGNSAAAGSNGGNVTVGAILTCNGGTGGATFAATTASQTAAGGAGGTAASGDFNATGQAGASGFGIDDTSSDYMAQSGKGGTSVRGQGGASATAITTGDTVAVAGSGCAAGGGGSISIAAPGTAQLGGTAASGCVIAYAYY